MLKLIYESKSIWNQNLCFGVLYYVTSYLKKKSSIPTRFISCGHKWQDVLYVYVCVYVCVCVYTQSPKVWIFSVSIYPPKYIQVVFISWLLWIMPQGSWFCRHQKKKNGGCLGLREEEIEWCRSKGQRRQWQPTPVLLPGKSHG